MGSTQPTLFLSPDTLHINGQQRETCNFRPEDIPTNNLGLCAGPKCKLRGVLWHSVLIYTRTIWTTLVHFPKFPSRPYHSRTMFLSTLTLSQPRPAEVCKRSSKTYCLNPQIIQPLREPSEHLQSSLQALPRRLDKYFELKSNLCLCSVALSIESFQSNLVRLGNYIYDYIHRYRQ